MTSLVSQLYKSRKILLELLKRRGFDVKGYDNFSFSELRVMNANKQLDMLLTNPTPPVTRKWRIKMPT